MKFNSLDIDKIMFNGLPVTSAMIDGVDIFKAKIYGVSWDKSETPTLIRTDDAVGMVANAGIDDQVVVNDFDAAEIYKDITEVTDAYGNVFVRIPKFYIKKTDAENLKTWQISKKPFTGAYLPWCFWDFTNNIALPYLDFGKYKAGLDGSNRLTSKSGEYPLINQNIVNCRTYARNNGAGYQQLDVAAYDVLQTLFLVEFATIDSQSIMQGFSTGRYTATDIATVTESGTNRIVVSNAVAANYRVGQPISIGTTQGGNQIFYGRTIIAIETYDADNKSIVFDGTPVNIAVGNMLYNTGWKNGFGTAITAKSGSIVANDGKYPCMYRGIESPWGDVWQWVDGVNINEYQAWVARNADDYVSNVFAHPYEQLGYVNNNADGNVTEMGYDANLPFAEFPVIVGVNKYKDYYWQNSGQRVALVGGSWDSWSDAGLFYWDLYYSSGNAYVNIGARLLRKPL